MPGASATIRKHSRISLYVALLCTIGGVLGLLRLSQPPSNAEMQRIDDLQGLWQGVDFAADPAVQLLQQYVAIDTSEPNADELSGARFLADRLAEAGLTPHIEHVGERRANVWAFVEGEDPKAIVLSGHIDVEPATEQEGWRFPPFSGAIDGPWIFGRGMYDMKSLAIAQLLATTDIARSGRKPKRSILFLQTSAEEENSDTGVRWILRQHPELVERMGVVLTEGGVVEAMSAQEVKYWGIEFAQKRFANLTFCSERRERLADLQTLLNQTGKPDPEPNVDPGVREFLRHYAATRGLGNYRAFLAKPEQTVRRRSEYDQLSNFMQALFRNEIVAFPPEESPAGGFTMRVAVHLLPQAELDPVLAELVPDWKTVGLSYTLQPDLGSRAASPVDTPLFAQLVRAIEEAHPGVPVGPYFLPWAATDSRFYRERGIPSYGFSPFLLTVTETLQTGRPNERMQLPGYLRGIELYRKLIRELAG